MNQEYQSVEAIWVSIHGDPEVRVKVSAIVLDHPRRSPRRAKPTQRLTSSKLGDVDKTHMTIDHGDDEE